MYVCIYVCIYIYIYIYIYILSYGDKYSYAFAHLDKDLPSPFKANVSLTWFMECRGFFG